MFNKLISHLNWERNFQMAFKYFQIKYFEGVFLLIYNFFIMPIFWAIQ